MDVPHFTLIDNYAPGIPYQKQEENTHLVKPGTFPPLESGQIDSDIFYPFP